jgi:OOP family OmpA-OmpF porin
MPALTTPPQPVPPGDDAVAGRAAAVPDDADFATLRRLLLGEEWIDLNVIRTRLRDPELHAHDISLILARAIVRASQRDSKLRSALLPVVEDALRISVQRDPKVLANLIYPAIGGAILKSVSALLDEKLEALNMAVEQSFTLRGLQWRMEAWRTGKPVGEIAMLRSLLFRVEQVFLIDRRTGVLLAQQAAPGAAVHDADMMSGMLTAIRDFVSDSFGEQQNQDLQTVQVGEFRLWIEHGPLALLVGVVRGPAPMELRKAFRQALEEIHTRMGETLAAFRGGDLAEFKSSEAILETCLVGTAAPSRKRASYKAWLWLAALLLCAGLGYLGFREWRYRQWERLAASLNSEPGIVLTGIERAGGKLILSGLRDPLAGDSEQLLKSRGLPAEHFELRLRGFESQDPALAEVRARLAHQEWLRSLNITFEEDSTVISSLATVQIAEAAKRILAIQGNQPPLKPIVVWGEADGSGERNTNLAQARAEAVAKLLQDLGVPREWITVQSSPVQAPGENATVRKLMRRVALRLDN